MDSSLNELSTSYWSEHIYHDEFLWAKLDSNDNLFAVWYSDQDLYMKKNGSFSLKWDWWATNERLTWISIDSSNNMYVFWYSNYIFYLRKINPSWTTLWTKTCSPAYPCFWSAIDIDSNGYIYLVWSSNSNFYLRKMDGNWN